MKSIVKRCSCGQTFTLKQWEQLHLIGVVEYEWGEVHDMRNCPCGSTLVIVLVEGAPE